MPSGLIRMSLTLFAVLCLALSASAQPSFSATEYGTGNIPDSIAIGDLNGDGHADLVVVNRATFLFENVSVFLNLGAGSFADGVFYNTLAPANPNAVAIGDLDGDGDEDLAVVSSGNGTGVSVLSNLGDGTYSGAVGQFEAGDGSRSVAIGDLDGDGDADLAVANAFSNTVSVLLNLGNGTFAAPVAYGVGDLPFSVAIGDLNGDGTPDLATANLSLGAVGTVSVLLNNGGGTFSDDVLYGTGFAPSSVAIGDLDDDGKPDLAITNSNSGSVSVLLNIGGGVFADQVVYGTGASPFSVAIGDLDGDGDSDLVVANPLSDNLSMLLNLGGGTFADDIQLAAGAGPASVAVGDLDGDGDADIAVANQDGNSLSVLLNLGSGTPLAPDLFVADIIGPLEGIAGEPIEVQWAVGNQGDSTAEGAWVDRVYLSTDQILSGDDGPIGSARFDGLLDPGDSYDRSETFIPGEPGTFYIIVQTDADDDVIELAGEGNNAAAADQAVVVTPLPVPGDVDGDGQVGFADLLSLLQSWGGCPDCGDCPADIDGDCTVGFSDVLVVLQSWS